MINPSPEQVAVLSEIVNMGVGQAASALSDMVDEEVLLSVPHLEFLAAHEMESHMTQTIETQVDKEVVILKQGFAGACTGQSMLIFPEEKSLNLVRAALPDDVPLETLSELEEDSLEEIGNVILSYFVASIAEAWEKEFDCGLTTCHHGSIDKIFDASPDQFLLALNVDFSLASQQINGNLLFLLDMSHFSDLLDKLELMMQAEL